MLYYRCAEKAIQKKQFKKAEATGSLTSNKIASKTTKVSKTLPQSTSETVERQIEIPRERCTYLEKKTESYSWSILM